MKRVLFLLIAIGLIMASGVDVTFANVTWKGLVWDPDGSGGSLAVNGDGNLVVTSGSPDGADYWGTAHINTSADFRSATNPWIQVSFLDDGSGPGARLGVEDESAPDQAWTSFGTKASRSDYYWYWWDVDANTDGLTSLSTRAAGEHTMKVGELADGSVEYLFDGVLVGHTTTAQVQWTYFGDVYLDAFTGAIGQSVTFTDFQMGSGYATAAVPEPDHDPRLGYAGCGCRRFRHVATPSSKLTTQPTNPRWEDSNSRWGGS